MALNSLGLGFVFTARDLASARIGRLARNFGAMDRASSTALTRQTRNLRLLGAGLGILATGAIAVGGALALASGAGQFEQGLARVAGITRATVPEMASLRNAAIEAGIATQFSPDEAVEGLRNLGSQGFRANESIRLLTPSLALAAGGMISVDAATQSVASATRVFRLSMDDAAGSADRLLRITQLTSLQAGDLQQALGGVARGASQTRQNMNEMLISMGLVRNTGVQASVAASSVSSALQFMARNAGQIRSTLGVSVTDASGNFRNFLDIVQEASGQLNARFPNAADRASTAMRLFGRFGITAFSAIQTQLTTGVRNASGAMVQGAEAVAELRRQMQAAGGTARGFQERLLSTFTGQVTLLRGSVQTLRIVVGEAFAQAFRPIIAGIVGFVNQLIAAWRAIPTGVRQGIASFVLAAGTILSALGTFITFSAIVALIAPSLAVIGKAMGVLALALLPLIAIFGAAVGVIVGFRRIFRLNIGGIATFVSGIVNRIRLTWRGLTSLFTRGGFSRGLLRELERSQNRGVLRFVVGVFQLAFRLQRLWDGLRSGITGVIFAMGPAIQVFIDAFREVIDVLGLSQERAGELGGALPSSSFVRFGQMVGKTIGRVLRTIVTIGTGVLRFVSGFVAGVRTAFNTFRPVFEAAKTGIVALRDAFIQIGRQLGIITGDVNGQSGSWRTFGNFIGGFVVGGLAAIVTIFGAVARAISLIVGGVSGAIDIFQRFFRVMNAVAITSRQIFANVVVGAQNMVDTLISGLGRFARAIPSRIRPAFLSGVAREGRSAESRIEARNAGLRTQNIEFAAARRAELAGPAQARTSRQTVAENTQVALAQQIRDSLRSQQGGIFRIALNVDGRKIASATQRVNRSDRAARGQPVSSDE